MALNPVERGISERPALVEGVGHATRASVFIIVTIPRKKINQQKINRKKVVARNPLRLVTAEGEINIFEGAFETVDARLVLHPQTPFRAFPVQVVISVHHFFYLIYVYRGSPP